MTSVRPTPQQTQAMVELVTDGPIVMVNLLKFRARAEYRVGTPEATENLTGRDAYVRYGRRVAPILGKLGAHFVYAGRPTLVLIGEAQDEWDEVALVSYPTKGAFLGMVMSPEYQAVSYHRDAALERTALLCTVEDVTP